MSTSDRRGAIVTLCSDQVRAERHDNALVQLKREHQAHVESLTAEFKRDMETAAARHQQELDRSRAEGADNLNAAVEGMRRQQTSDSSRMLEDLRYELEEQHRVNLSAVMQQHQEALRGITEQHKLEMREKIAQMALQKDELHRGDKSVALKAAAQDWETEMNRRVRKCEDKLNREHSSEIESIRRECNAAIDSMATKVSAKRA